MLTALTAFLTVLAALLDDLRPLIVTMARARAEKERSDNALLALRAQRQQLAAALAAKDPVGVAAAFALLDEQLDVLLPPGPGADPGAGERLGDPGRSVLEERL
jgi:hypothetical protein